MTEQTPAQVARAATIQDALGMGNLTVIGLMRAHDGPAALLRSSRGRIARVTAGSRAFGYVVTAIADDYLLIADRSGASYRLTVPGRDAAAS